MTYYSISPQVCQFKAWKIILIVISGILFLFAIICVIIKIILVILVSRLITGHLESCFHFISNTLFLSLVARTM